MRSARTLTLYASLGCLGYVLSGLGAILPELRSERGLPRGEVALYPSAFALGLVIVGAFGHRAARSLGPYALPAALAALAAGTALLTAGTGRLGTGTGAVLLGLGGAGLVQLVPMGLRAEHGAAGTVAIGEANAVASTASVLAPLLIGLALGQGLGWRVGFLAPPLIVALLLLAVLARHPHQATADTDPGRGAPGPAPPAFWRWWLDLVLAVAVEFCLLFWAADFLRTAKGLDGGTATVASAGFVLGMAAGRAATGPAVRRLGKQQGGPARLLAEAAALAAAGFAVLWAAPAPAALAGLIVTGLGVALLYPVILGEALATWTSNPERAAARCALGSGLAIGTAPPILGLLADAIGVRTAMLVAPLLLLILLLRRTIWRSGRRP